MNGELLAQLDDLRRRTARLESLESLPKTEALLTTGANTGATEQAQAMTYPVIAPWFDAPLASATEGDYFNQNSASVPTGWSAPSGFAAAATDTRTALGFWYLSGTSTVTAWKYRERVAALGNSAISFDFGPILWRDPGYTADVTYTFGLYRDDGSGTIDETQYNSVQLNYSATYDLWRVRSVMTNGTTTYTSDYQAITVPLMQGLFVRVTSTGSNNNKRAHFGQRPQALTHTTLDNRTLAITWNTPWVQISMSRGGGNSDILLVGGIDRTANV